MRHQCLFVIIMHICYSLRQGLNFVITANLSYTHDASIEIAGFINLGNVNYYILYAFTLNI